jgi:hypothetical protein
VEGVEPEVDEAAGGGARLALRVDEAHVLLDEVPTAGAHHDGGGALGGDPVLLALGARVLEAVADRVGERQLPPDDVPPGGAGGVLLVGEPDARARVHRVDGHLRVGGTGDLHAAILQAGPGAGDAPARVLADRAGVVAELRIAAVADLVASALAVREALVPGAREAAVQLGEELEGLGGEDLVAAVERAADDLDAGAGGGGGGGLLLRGRLRGDHDRVLCVGSRERIAV